MVGLLKFSIYFKILFEKKSQLFRQYEIEKSPNLFKTFFFDRDESYSLCLNPLQPQENISRVQPTKALSITVAKKYNGTLKFITNCLELLAGYCWYKHLRHKQVKFPLESICYVDVVETVVETSRQVRLLCPWVRHLTGCPRLYVEDRWPINLEKGNSQASADLPSKV